MSKDLGILARRVNGKLVLSGACFRIHMKLKTIAGWQYDPVTKRWTIPETGEAAFLSFAAEKDTPVTWLDASDAEATPEATPEASEKPAKARKARAATPEAPEAPEPPEGSLDAYVIGLIRRYAAPASETEASSVDTDKVAEMIAAAIAEIQKPRQLIVTIGEETRHTTGLAHKCLPLLIQSLTAGLHVWLAGPSGSGKTHAAEQAAEALGLSFELQGAMTMAHELMGFVDAGGRYHDTPFVRAFVHGGLILLDEIDAGSNEALLCLNAALANGVMSLPTGDVVRVNADFKCIGAANTYGGGASHEYVGRTRIDAAFLQRFGAAIQWDYDESLELEMSGNRDWALRVIRARDKARAAGLKVLITPRASQAGARLIAAGLTPDKAAEMTYLRGLTPEQRDIVGG